MKMKETDQKSHAKALITLVIVLSILVILLAIIDVFQIIKVGELKASIVEKDKANAKAIVEKDKANAKAIAEKDIIIADLRILNKKLKEDMGPMALQAAAQQKEIKALKHSLSEFTVIAAGLIKLEKECANLCDKFVPGVLKCLKEFEALINQLAKAKAKK